MDTRRFYVVSPRGELGPFTVEELIEELEAGRITATHPVRTGMGTMLGSVRKVLDTPEAMWNTAESGSGLSPVAMAQRRNRIVSVTILGLTLVPALMLIAFLGAGTTTTVTASTPTATASPDIPQPPPRSQTAVPSSVPVRPPAGNSVGTPPPPSASTSSSPSSKPRAFTSTPDPLAVAAIADGPIRQAANGVLRLTASTATITSKGARLQGKGTDNPHIGSWNFGEGGVEWEALIDRPGSFEVTITYACNRSGAGSKINFSADNRSISDLTVDTSSWDAFKPHRLSQPLTISRAGLIKFTLVPNHKKNAAFMKLSGVLLTPVPTTR